jgi:hypothetical protein
MNAAVAELFDGVDDLIRRVAHTENPEVRKIRAKVHAALVAAKNQCGPIAAAPGRTAGGRDPLYDDEGLPAPTVGVVFLLGLGLCLIAASDAIPQKR